MVDVGVVDKVLQRYVLVRDVYHNDRYILADARPELQTGTVIIYRSRFVQGAMWRAENVARVVTILRLCAVSLLWALALTVFVLFSLTARVCVA
jgi:hypothetical protein